MLVDKCCNTVAELKHEVGLVSSERDKFSREASIVSSQSQQELRRLEQQRKDEATKLRMRLRKTEEDYESLKAATGGLSPNIDFMDMDDEAAEKAMRAVSVRDDQKLNNYFHVSIPEDMPVSRLRKICEEKYPNSQMTYQGPSSYEQDGCTMLRQPQ